MIRSTKKHGSAHRPRTRLKGGLAILLALAGSFCATGAGAMTAGIMGGGPFYSGGASVMSTLRASGFNTIILWTIHVNYPSGDLVFNDQKVCTNGVYMGATNWPSQLATLKQAPTSVTRIEVCVGSGGGPNDFQSIQNLITAQGTGTNSILYRNFRALKEATGADAVCFNDETQYDSTNLVTFGQMLAALGAKVTLCPYTQPTVWQRVKSELGTTVDAVYLQCYAGGAENNPATWNTYFGGLKVQPGLWCKHASGCTAGDTAAAVATKMTNWQATAGITGGWMWLYDDMLDCTANSPAEYAAAITGIAIPPASFTWDGGGTNYLWTSSTNWVGDIAPGTGTVVHFAGSARLTPSNNLPAGTSIPSLYFDSGASAFTLRGNPVALSGTIENNSSATQTVDMPIILATGTTVLIRTILGSGDLTLRGVISGSGNIEKQVQAANATTAILSGSNTYSGKTVINAGNLSISSIKPMGFASPSSVGMPSPGNGTIAMGTASKLIYTGTGDTTDRGLDLQGSPLRFTQAGSGLLKLAGDVSTSVAGAKVLTLDGAATGELAGAIANPPSNGNTRIVKEGAGTWILSGTNLYAGNTTISAGTLALSGGGSISNSLILDISAGAILDVSGVGSLFTLGGAQTLRGAGTVQGSAMVAGTVDPGAGSTCATLTVQGTVSFASGATNKVDITATSNDVLSVAGDVDLANCALVVSGAPTNGSYIVLRAGGALAGTFNGLADDAQVPGTGYSIDYVRGASPAYVALNKITSPIKYVIHISVDGMHSDAPRTLVDKGVGPNFKRLFDEGAYTERARTDYGSTVTSPNHATIFTGRPVSDWPGKPGHLWGNNDTHPWDRWALTLHQPHYVGTYYGPGPGLVFVYTNAQYFADSGPNRIKYEYLSSVLDVVHDSGRRTGMYYGKDRLTVEAESYGAVHGRLYPKVATNDPGVSKVDHSEYDGPFGVMSNWIPQMVAEPFQYSFLHFSLPDDRGHSFTWSLSNKWNEAVTNFTDAWNTNLNRYVNGSYMGAIQQVDGWLGEVFSLIETNAELTGKTAIVLTTDHGGLLGAFDHGFVNQPDCYRIDVFAWGPGIPAGADLYAMNRQFTDPGRTNRPDYNDPHQPIRNGDTPNLVLSLLGLGPIPGSSLNTSQSLGVVDSDGDGLSDNYETSIFLDALKKDTDGDGTNDGDELTAGTNPTNSESVFEISGLDLPAAVDGPVVTWSSESNRLYTLWGSTNLDAGYQVITGNIPATPFVNAYTGVIDGAGQMLYRIGVQP